MTLPPMSTTGERISASRTKAHALRQGFAPPLAWTNIDDPDEQPNLGGVDDQIDPVVVDRLLHLERVVSTRAEKVEAMRQWLAMGRSQRSLCAAELALVASDRTLATSLVSLFQALGGGW